MSDYKVVVRKVESLKEIEGADRILAATINDCGYTFVVKRGEFEVGDYVVWIPLDGILPEATLKAAGFWDETKNQGVLSGGEHNRVKTVKLRGQISQGLILRPDLLPMAASPELYFQTQEDLAPSFGIAKYEPPQIFSQDAKGAIPRPAWLPKYDIEGAQYNPEMFERVINCGQRLFLTEKVEGMNFCLTLEADGTFRYFSRNMELLEPSPNHAFMRAIANEHLHDKMYTLREEFPDVKKLSLRGEIVGAGIQGNWYDLKDYRVYAFDLYTDSKYQDWQILQYLFAECEIRTVPFLAAGNGIGTIETFVKESHGMSLINPDKLREGIVLRPVIEMADEKGERLIIKQRDPIYLEKTDNDR